MKRCEKCSRLLRPGDEAHIVGESVYCSEECAIATITDEIIMNAKEAAKEYYNSEVTIATVRTKDSAVCAKCGADLAMCEVIFAAEGFMYCSRGCGIDEYVFKVGPLYAEGCFDDVAEEMTPAEIGLEVCDEQSS